MKRKVNQERLPFLWIAIYALDVFLIVINFKDWFLR